MTEVRSIDGTTFAFCASSRTGLGHLRRITNVATALKRLLPQSRLCLISNAGIAGLSAAEQRLFDHFVVAERRAMARAAAAAGAHVLVVDTAVVPDLELLPLPMALVLRETVEARLAAFRPAGGRLWDVAIVAEPASGWTASAATVGARRVVNVGWIYRTPGPPEDVLYGDRSQRTLLVATGGGGNAETAAALKHEIEPLIDEVRRRVAGDTLRVVQAAGPRTPSSSRLRNADVFADVGSRLDKAFAEADLVISTAGYNSVLELAATETPALLVPIARTYDDQVARSRTWASRIGLDHWPGEIGRSADWIVHELASGRRRPAVDLGRSGCAQAAGVIASLSGVGSVPESAWSFVKPRKPGTPAAALTAQRADRLFARGVPTPPVVTCNDRDAVASARIEGPTAYDVFATLTRGDRGLDRRALASFCPAAMRPLARLHEAAAAALELQPLDPCRRIGPRLGRHAVGSGITVLAGMLREAAQRAAARCRASIVHGDFHLRQLIRPTGRDDYVLVDLDDLAIGAPESDIGNGLAHLATSGGRERGNAAATFLELLPFLADGYAEASGRRLDGEAVRCFGALALLRRALKLAENGTAPAMAAAIIEGAFALADPAVMAASSLRPYRDSTRHTAAIRSLTECSPGSCAAFSSDVG